ncbi:MAG: PqqD family protein [Xanthomonadales bacterium]|nr:PqqD family protein [Xanthomonadales bacterium]
MNEAASTPLDTAWQLDPGVRFRRILDEAVVIHQERAETLVLNDTGVSFLELCDGRRTVGEIAGLMARDFDTTVEQLAPDLLQFADQLHREGIVAQAQGSST